MNRPTLFALICSLPLIGACTDNDIGASEGRTAPQFGNAVKGNIAAQIVNPNAPADGGPLTMNGQRAAAAQDRYAKGQVIKPEEVGVSNGTGSGGDSGGSGGGDSGSSASGGSSGGASGGAAAPVQ